MSHSVLCVGEILWDALPNGLFLGGAPLNVAYHLQALGREGRLASRVGNDRLGDEARRLQVRGLNTDLVQIDPSLPTGFVEVALETAGEPDYEIVEPAAWDALEMTDHLRRSASRARAFVYGGLAQRRASSRKTIRRPLRD